MLSTLRRCGWQFSLIVVLVLSGCGPRPSETSTTAVEADAALGARMEAAASGALREFRAAGFSIAVVRDGQLVLAKGYGYANLAERVAAAANTIYRLASITKQFTAAAILHLVEEGSSRSKIGSATTCPTTRPLAGGSKSATCCRTRRACPMLRSSPSSKKAVAWDTPGTRSSTWSLRSRSTSSRGPGTSIATWVSCSPGW